MEETSPGTQEVIFRNIVDLVVPGRAQECAASECRFELWVGVATIWHDSTLEKKTKRMLSLNIPFEISRET